MEGAFNMVLLYSTSNPYALSFLRLPTSTLASDAVVLQPIPAVGEEAFAASISLYGVVTGTSSNPAFINRLFPRISRKERLSIKFPEVDELIVDAE